MNIRLFSVPLEKRKIFFQRRSMQKTAALGLVINCRFWGRPLPYHLLWDITDPIRQMIRSAAAGFFTMDMGRNEAAAKAAVKPSFGGSSLIWKIQNHPWSYFMASSDYIGGIHLFRFKNIRIDNAYTLQYNQGRKDGDGHARRCELVNSAGLHAQGTGGRDPGRCGPYDVRSVYHAA